MLSRKRTIFLTGLVAILIFVIQLSVKLYISDPFERHKILFILPQQDMFAPAGPNFALNNDIKITQGHYTTSGAFGNDSIFVRACDTTTCQTILRTDGPSGSAQRVSSDTIQFDAHTSDLSILFPRACEESNTSKIIPKTWKCSYYGVNMIIINHGMPRRTN